MDQQALSGSEFANSVQVVEGGAAGHNLDAQSNGAAVSPFWLFIKHYDTFSPNITVHFSQPENGGIVAAGGGNVKNSSRGARI